MIEFDEDLEVRSTCPIMSFKGKKALSMNQKAETAFFFLWVKIDYISLLLMVMMK